MKYSRNKGFFGGNEYNYNRISNIYINKRRQTLNKLQIHSFDKYIKTNKRSKIDFIYNFNFNKYK